MQQYGRDYTESYAPVVQWSLVQLCIILAIMLDLPTQQIDFLQAFCNADIDARCLYCNFPGMVLLRHHTTPGTA